MNAKFKAAIFILLTAACGVGVVTWETPQNFLLFVIWFAITTFGTRRLRTLIGPKKAIVTGSAHVSLMAAIVVFAILAPVKRIDAVLKKTVHLTAKTMTVDELSKYCQMNRKTLPLAISIPSRGNATQQHLQFSSTTMPLQQFISEFERQTGCQHRMNGCGNAYTVLYGSAYNFGLSFDPVPGSGYEWE